MISITNIQPLNYKVSRSNKGKSLNAYYFLPANHNVKNFNKHAAVDLIRFAGKSISRTDIAEALDLSRAGVSIIINDLIDNKIILETYSRTTPSGRPPVVLELNPKAGMVAGIDMGASHLSAALGDFSARILKEIEHPFKIADGPEKCIDDANQILNELLERQGIGIKDLSAIGVSVPGPVITDAGMVMAPPIMPGWDRFPIRDTLEKRWSVPVTINNDADLGAMGEWAYGAGRNEINLAFIKVGSGIGAGFIINQQIFVGSTGSAGEIGHLTIEKNGPLCSCGNYGCLEAFASGKAIELQAQKLVESGKRTLLTEIKERPISVLDVANAARSGDLEAQEILNRAGTFIGIALAGLINMFNPSVVIIGGGVAEVGDLITAPIRKMVKERSLRASEHAVKITTAMLGRRSTLIGAMVQANSLAIHNMVEGKSPLSRVVYTLPNNEKEVVLTGH
jgi:glucokinase-like ROK family protein